MYEMLFYMLVVLALALRVPVFAVAGPALCSLVLANIAGVLEFPDAIIAEFLFGVLIGEAIKHGKNIPLPIAAALFWLGFAAILSGPVITPVLRPITWGIPAACIVAGAVAFEERLSAIIPRWALDAGDASYSIYLMHSLVVPGVYIVLARIVPETLLLPATIVSSLLASTAVGRLGFTWIERPLLHWLRRPRPAPIVATQSAKSAFTPSAKKANSISTNHPAV
jgi:exopolysaccharide production protein ExoZ